MESGLRAFSAANIAGLRRSPEGGRYPVFLTPTAASLGLRSISCKYKVYPAGIHVAWSMRIVIFALFGQPLISAAHAPTPATRGLNLVRSTFPTLLPPTSLRQTWAPGQAFRQRRVCLGISSVGPAIRLLTQRSAKLLDCRTFPFWAKTPKS